MRFIPVFLLLLSAAAFAHHTSEHTMDQINNGTYNPVRPSSPSMPGKWKSSPDGNPLNTLRPGDPPYIGVCRAQAGNSVLNGDEDGFVNWCMNQFTSNPNTRCAANTIPCGNVCFSYFLGQSCENNKVIACTDNGRARRRC